MNKKIKTYVKLQILAGQANPSPPIGPALGQHGINIMSFCKEFNLKTKNKNKMLIPVLITIYSNKSFSFITKISPTSILLKKSAGLTTNKKPGSGSKNPGKEQIATINIQQVEEIAKTKMNDLNAFNIKNAIKIISGTAKSMGIKIIK